MIPTLLFLIIIWMGLGFFGAMLEFFASEKEEIYPGELFIKSLYGALILIAMAWRKIALVRKSKPIFNKSWLSLFSSRSE